MTQLWDVSFQPRGWGCPSPERQLEKAGHRDSSNPIRSSSVYVFWGFGHGGWVLLPCRELSWWHREYGGPGVMALAWKALSSCWSFASEGRSSQCTVFSHSDGFLCKEFITPLPFPDRSRGDPWQMPTGEIVLWHRQAEPEQQNTTVAKEHTWLKSQTWGNWACVNCTVWILHTLHFV